MQKKILLLLVIIMLIVAGCTKAPAAENKPAVAPKSTGVANLDAIKAKANEIFRPQGKHRLCKWLIK